MKPYYLFVTISVILGFSAFQSAHLQTGILFKGEKPQEHYFLSKQYPYLGEGIDEYKNAVIKELKRIKQTRAYGNAWKMEGPLNTGGRINCVAIHPTSANTYLVGCADGGIFKTTDGGQTWTPVFDEAYALSVSSIEFDPNNPQIVYAGTGDEVLGGYSHIGNGIYKSTDGGNTWANSGLKNTGVVGKIIIDPNNSSTIYAGTTGNPFLYDPNRGVYKSTDAGATWTKVLYLGTGVGIGDMVINTTNSSIIYATGRHRFRSNNASIITGQRTKIYRSSNGGSTWDTLSSGLPVGDQCRIGLCISSSNPDILYANYVDNQLECGGIYKTTNGGNSWTMVNDGSSINMGGFGWYFGPIGIDPNDNNKVYVLAISLYKSTNGGVNFSDIGSFTHADKHDLKFKNSSELLLGTDGGFYTSNSGGSSWTLSNNLPITQFYEVGYNPFDSLNYYGGAQDNGSNVGSALSGLNNWIHYYGGDGFKPAFNWANDQVLYTEWQNGNIVATDNGGASWSDIAQSVISSDRTSWNTPYLVSSFNPDDLYMGTYRVHKNTWGPFDGWSPISNDLTDGTNNTFHIISDVDQSSLSAGLLYVGTSDSRVWITSNDGANWTLINTGLPNRYVSAVKASPNSTQQAVVSFSGYRNNDSLPHIYYTTNQGTTWTSIAGDLPNFAINDVWIQVGKQDSNIVVATDGGVYATRNKGAHWERVGNNMPIIPVFDIDYNPATKRLIAGTFARSMQTIEVDSVFNGKEQTNVGLSHTSRSNEIVVYPNPCQTYFSLAANDIQEVNIIDLYGRILRHYTGQYITSRYFPCGDLKNGHYVVAIQTNKGITYQTLQILQ